MKPFANLHCRISTASLTLLRCRKVASLKGARGVLVALSAAGRLSPGALAHSWYPHRCCNDMDCFPAESTHRDGHGNLVLSRGRIVVRIPRSFPIEASPDGKVHFCVWDSGWGYEARCVFLPADS